MDPELTEQLNESMRQLSEMVAQLNSTMAGTVSSMKSATDAGKSAADAARQNADRQTTSSNQVISGQTKASAAMQQAEEKMAIAFKNVNAALSSTAAGLASFSKSMLSAEAGFGKYTNATTSLGDAALSLGRNFGILGALAGGVIKFFTFFAGDSLRLVDNLVQFRDETTKVTGVLPTTLEGLEQLSREARFSGEAMLKLQKITTGLGTSLVSLGGIAGTGAVKFMQMADVSDGLRRKFGLLGVSQERLAELQSLYVRHQTASGTQYSLQNKSMEQLRKESLAYADNMTRLSALTGEQAEDIEKQQAIVQMQLEEQVQVRSENARIRQLEKSGREEDKQEAAKIRAEQRARKAVLDEATARMGPEMSAQLGRIIRTGGYDSITGPLATLGIDFTALSQKVKNARGMSEEDAAKYGQQIAGQLTNNMQDAYDRQSVVLGTAIQYGGKELADGVGVYGETLAKLAQTEGKTAEELDAMEKAARAKAEQDAGLAKEEENRRKMERELQAEYQKALMPIAKQLLPFITSLGWKMVEALKWAQSNMELLSSSFKVAIGVMGVLVGATALGGVVNLFKNLLGAGSGLKSLFGIGSGKLGSRGNPMHVTMDGIGGPAGPAQRAAKAAIDDAQLLDKNGNPLRGAAREARAAKLAREAAAAAPARTGILGKAGGMLGKAGGMLGKAGKFIPGVGWLMTAGMAAAEGIGAYNDAENVMGIKGRQATTGEKLTAGAAGALSSLTFGLVDTKTIAGGLSKTFGVLGDVLKPVIETGKAVVSTVFSPFIAVGKLVYDNWESIYNIGKNVVGVATDLIKIAFYPMIAVGKLIYRNWDSIVDVGKKVVNVVFWPFIQVGKVVYNGWDKIANLFKVGIGYLDSLWSKIKGFTGWLTGWLYGDDEEKKEEPAKTPDSKPAEPAQPKPQPKADTGSSWFSGVSNWLFGPDEEEKPAAPKPAPAPAPKNTDPTGDRKRVAEKTHDAATINKGAADTSRRASDQDTVTSKKNKETILLFNSIVTSFGKIVTAEGSIVASFGRIVTAFKEAITKFEQCVNTLSTAIQNGSLGGGGSITPTAGAVPQNVRGNLEMIAQGLRKSGFGDENYINAVLGNVMKESGGRFDRQEDIAGYKNTSNARIREVFKSKVRGMSDAELDALKSDPQAFANKIYGSRMGNKQPGDGWLFRGRGPIQLTGRGNYAKASKDIFGDDRLVKNPDLVMEPEVGVQVIAWFLHQNESQMRGKLGLSKTGLLSKQEAALLATSQIAGQAITRGSGYLGTENLSKVEGFASAMPTGVGSGGTWGPDSNSQLALGKSDGDISALGRDLQKMGIRVSEHPDFGGVQGKHAGRAHYEGRALDLNIVSGRDVDNPRAAQIFDELKPKLMQQGFTTLWRVGGHYDHMHVQKGADGVKAGTSGVVAAKGGVFDGSKGGYPATLHGTELVAPLNVDSILMKMAKTPADAADAANEIISSVGSGKSTDKIVERMMSRDSEMIMLLSGKLDKMIDVLENGNDTRHKILKHSRL